MRMKLAVLAWTCLVCVAAFPAQSPAILSGHLADSSGAAIAGASVIARPISGSGSYETTTAADGQYQLSLPVGQYRVRISDAAFVAVERDVTLANGEPFDWSPRLALRPLASTVIVTADARPLPVEDATGPVDVVSEAKIRQREVVALAPLLASLPGISISQLGAMGGITTLFLDGGNSSFTKVLVDGTPVNEPGGNIDLSNYLLGNVAKVEVVHGAASALFGSDAMTGVVQIFTRRGTTRQPQVDVYADGGKFSTWHTGANISGLAGRFDYSAAAAAWNTGGQGPNDRFRDNTLSGNFGWKFSTENRLRLVVRSSASDAGVAGQTLFLPPDPNQHDALKNVLVNFEWDVQTGAHWQHHWEGSESYLGETYADPPVFTTRNEYNRAGFEEQSSYLFASGALTAGYGYEVENGYYGGVHQRRNNQAGYAEAQVEPFRRLTLLAGGRAEANPSFGTRVVPRLGASYALRLGSGFWGPTRAYASYGLGIKEPTFFQSYFPDPCFPGNPDLRPERSRTIDAGIDQALGGDRARVSVNAFDNLFYDVISFGPGPLTAACPFGTGTYFNTDRARAYGGSARLDLQPRRWLTLLGNYTYDNTRVLRAPNAYDPTLAPGNRLFLRPLNSADFIANLSARRTDWSAEAQYVGRRTDSDFLGLGLTSVPSYFLLNLGASYRLGRGVSSYARVDNVLDRGYQIVLGYPALRAAYRVGLRYTWGGR